MVELNNIWKPKMCYIQGPRFTTVTDVVSYNYRQTSELLFISKALERFVIDCFTSTYYLSLLHMSRPQWLSGRPWLFRHFNHHTSSIRRARGGSAIPTRDMAVILLPSAFLINVNIASTWIWKKTVHSAYRLGHSISNRGLTVCYDIYRSFKNKYVTIFASLNLSAAFCNIDHVILLQCI